MEVSASYLACLIFGYMNDVVEDAAHFQPVESDWFVVDGCVLQQTRIGKYVNEMRRRTVDRNLARRAKDLVRKWQQLVAAQSSAATGAQSSTPSASDISRIPSSGSLLDSGGPVQTNGIQPAPNRSSINTYSRLSTGESFDAAKQTSRSGTSDILVSRYQPSKGKTGLAEKLSARSSSHALSQPSTPVAAASLQSPMVSSSFRTTARSPVTYRPQTPSPRMTAKLPSANTSKLSPQYSHCVTNGSGPDAAGMIHDGSAGKMRVSGSSDALLDVKRKYSSGRNGMLKASSSSSNLVCNGIWSVHSSIDTDNGALERLTSSPDPSRAEAPLAKLKIKINRTSASGSVSSPVAELSPAAAPASSARKTTPKVATTAELIQRLHANGELRLVASETLNRIATNQIEHEADDSNVSIVPDGAKPRPHKKRRTDRLPDQLPPAMTDSDLLQVKAERVRSFVQMSAGASSGANDGDLLDLLSHLPPPASAAAAADASPDAEPEAMPADPVSLIELPSLDGFEIDWSSNAYTVQDARPPPTDADVDRLLSAQWPLVNGQYDHRGDWTDWTQSYSAPSYDGSLIHILPYVDIDD